MKRASAEERLAAIRELLDGMKRQASKYTGSSSLSLGLEKIYRLSAPARKERKR